MAESVVKSLQKGRRSKAPGAFRTISEVANELEVPQHVLRFWESKFAQIKPLKRGGGRRYYRPEDIDLLRGIRHLLYSDGYTIKGAQKLLREIGSKSIIEAVRNSSDGCASSVVGAVSDKSPGKERSIHRENTKSLRAGLEPKDFGSANVHSVEQIENLRLTTVQRSKLEDLATELAALRDILREARKG